MDFNIMTSFRCLPVLVLLSILPASAFSSTSLHMTATPGTMAPGFTKHLAINCSFDHSTDHNFGTLLNVIVSKETATSGHYTDVASLSPFGRGQLEVKDNLGSDVTGHFNNIGVSFVSFEWTDPMSIVEGNYRCEALGMDNLGHPKTSYATVSVLEQTVNLSMAFNKIDELKVQVDECQNSSLTIDMMNNCVEAQSNLTSTIHDLHTCHDDLHTCRDDLQTCHGSVSKMHECEVNRDDLRLELNDCRKDQQELYSQTTNLTLTVDELMTKYQQCNADLTKFNSTVVACRATLSNTTSHLDTLLSSNSRLTINLTTCFDDKNHVTTKLQTCENNEILLQSNLNICGQSVNTTNSLLADCTNSNNVSLSKIQECMAKNNNLSLLLDNCRSDSNGFVLEITNLTTQVKDLTTTSEQCQTDLSTANSSLDACKATLNIKNHRVTQLATNNPILRRNLTTCLNTTNQVTTKLETCENNEATLQTDLHQCQQSVTSMNSSLAHCNYRKNVLNHTNTVLKSQVGKCKHDLNVSETNNAHLSTQLRSRDQIVANQSQKLQALLDIFFHAHSGKFHGKKYYMSYPLPRNLTLALNTCQQFGGILAEINNVNEFNFIQDFGVASDSFEVGVYIMLGATDRESEGHWRYTSSGGSVQFFSWNMHQHNGGHRENCMFLAAQGTHNMKDDKCFKQDTPTRFLCEIHT